MPPGPQRRSRFGHLIGTYQDSTGASQAGAAYLFSTDGVLLNTITNPTSAVQDWTQRCEFGVITQPAGALVVGYELLFSGG